MNANELTILPLESPDWWTTSADGVWDVVVVGAGHAGAEASLAAARMGAACIALLASRSRDNNFRKTFRTTA